MAFLFELGGEHPDLARAECEALHPQAREWALRGRLLACESGSCHPERLALTKAAYELITGGPAASVRSFLEAHPRGEEGSVKYFKRLISGEELCSEDVYKALHAWLGGPRIDLEDPDETYGIIVDGDEWLVVRLLWRNVEDFEARKSHRRPAPHPTGMHPKLARAMINLSGAQEEVLDPFCGAGGLLLEASLMGLSAKGVDIDGAMVARARKNLEALGAKAVLVNGDALAYEKPSEVIVTDAPYGRNSRAEDLGSLFSRFLAHASSLTTRMVIGLPDITDNEALLGDSPWRVENRFVWRLHRSLCKEIFVLSSE